MAYQRFGEDSDLYIFQSSSAENTTLNVFTAHNIKTQTVSGNGGTDIMFSSKNLHEAENLLRALYDLMISYDRKIEINPKTKELKIRKARKNG